MNDIQIAKQRRSIYILMFRPSSGDILIMKMQTVRLLIKAELQVGPNFLVKLSRALMNHVENMRWTF